MKIERIDKIKGHRVFHDFNWSTELSDFSRFNLIYGWNGSGKTTLSLLFNYLQRREDITEGEVKFQIGGQSIDGSSISGAVIPQVRVFNRDSVDRSMFEVPNHELAPVFYLGEDSSDKQKEIELLKSEQQILSNQIRESQDKEAAAKKLFDDFCKNKALEIKGLLSSSGTGGYNTYNKANFSTKSDQLLACTPPAFCLTPEVFQEFLENKEGAVLKKIDLVSTSMPDYLNIVGHVGGLLKRSIVTDAITDLSENSSRAAWVQQGLNLHNIGDDDVDCYFCSNPISPKRIHDLEAHFNDQLTAFQREVDAEISELTATLNSVENLELPAESQFYTHLQNRYKSSVSQWSTSKHMVTVFLGTLIRALQEKREQPFKSIDLNQYLSLSAAKEKEKGMLMSVIEFMADTTQMISVSMGLGIIEKINRLITEHNEYTANFNEKVDKARRILETHTVSTYLLEYSDYKKTISIHQDAIADFNANLLELNDNLSQLEREIKEFVRPVEELNAEMTAYLGRDELQFQIQGNGYVISRNGHPALNLSEGERTAIAFMYFLKTLEDTDFDMAAGVVVIDDPISSLDANSMYSAFGFMKARTRGVNQLFVLTHSFTFFRHVRKWFFQEPKLPVIQGWQGSNDYRAPYRFYMLDSTINDNIRCSSIKAIDPLLRDYESEYQYIFKKVYDFVNGGSAKNLESYYGLPNIARRLLETFLTFKMPNLDADKIERKLDAIAFDQAKKIRMLRFLHVHSHYDQVGEPEHDLSLLAEAPSVLSDLLELIKSVDLEHYDGMASFFVLEPDTPIN